MKTLAIIMGFIFSLQSFAADTTLMCSDQNSHASYRIQISADLNTTQLITLVSDSSVLSAGSKILKIQEGESSPQLATYAGKTNNGLNLALVFNSAVAVQLEDYQILDVAVYFQPAKGEILSGKTFFLCSKE